MKNSLVIAFILIGLHLATAQKYEWAIGLGGADKESGTCIATDGNDNVYVCGFLFGRVDFDPGPGKTELSGNPLPGVPDLFFAKYDSEGNFLWVNNIRTNTGVSVLIRMAVSDAGDIHLTGTFFNSTDFDPGSDTSFLTAGTNHDAFFAKYDTDGNYKWAQRLGASGNEVGGSIGIDDSGNVYVMGNFEGAVDFDPGIPSAVLAAPGSKSVYVAKYDKNGNYIWAFQIGGSIVSLTGLMSVDDEGNVYVTGMFEGTADFDPGVSLVDFISNGDLDIYMAKYSSAGEYIWAHTFGSDTIDIGSSISIDPDKNVYIAGQFSDSVDFDPGSGVAMLHVESIKIEEDLFFAKYDSDGNYLWAHNLGTNVHTYPRIIPDGSSHVYLTGKFKDSLDFAPGKKTSILSSAGKRDIFIASYSSDGYFRWATSYGSYENDDAEYMAMDNAGALYITGNFKEVVDFDPDWVPRNLTSAGLEDIFIAKYMPWALQVRDLTSKSEIMVYPNPFNDEVIFETGNAFNDILTLKLYDSMGRLVKVVTSSNDNQIVLQKKHLESGLYFFQLWADTQLFGTGKLVAN